MRVDLDLIQSRVKPKARVLDLGCGDGALLHALRETKAVNGLGIEIDPDRINQCLRLGVNVIEQDLNQGLGNLSDDSFDVVVMAHSLQTLRNPRLAIADMLRVGRECVVTFPNFGHWHNRLQMNYLGRMPQTKRLPYNWYDTPNIHFFTIQDFEVLLQEMGVNVLDRQVLGASDSSSRLAKVWPNLFADTAIYHISK
jgi:methionine biosynthesis protein MetW